MPITNLDCAFRGPVHGLESGDAHAVQGEPAGWLAAAGSAEPRPVQSRSLMPGHPRAVEDWAGSITDRGAAASVARTLSRAFIKGHGLLFEPLGRMSCLALEPRAVAPLPSDWLVLSLWILNLGTNRVFLLVVAEKSPRARGWSSCEDGFK